MSSQTKHSYLIAGGAGFIGSHLCTRLLEHSDNEVVCLDNFYTGCEANIMPLLKNSRFKLVEHDIVHSFKGKFDTIINLGCPASPIHYQADPIYTMKTNILGTLNLIELARVNHATYLQASTSEVYGDPLTHPQNESYWGHCNPIGIRSCYDEGKRAAESICYDYRRKFDVDARVMRIFNTYGPNMALNDGRVVSNFIIQAIKNDEITIYGEGEQTRSFVILMISSMASWPF